MCSQWWTRASCGRLVLLQICPTSLSRSCRSCSPTPTPSTLSMGMQRLSTSTNLRSTKRKFKVTMLWVAQSSGAGWELRWTSWAVHPNEPSGFHGCKAILNHAHALVSACPWYVNWHPRTLSITRRKETVGAVSLLGCWKRKKSKIPGWVCGEGVAEWIWGVGGKVFQHRETCAFFFLRYMK